MKIKLWDKYGYFSLSYLERKKSGLDVLSLFTAQGGWCSPLPPFTLTAPDTMAASLLWLLGLGALLLPSEAQEAYDSLPETFRRGVDLALEKLDSHAGIQHHFVFSRSVTQSDIEAGFGVVFIYHHFYLKPTKCPKGTADPSGCQLRNDRPMIDCAVCYKTFGGGIEQEPKPYVHCVHKPALTEEMKTTRVNHCNTLGYSSGSPTLLASTGNSDV
uniref:Retinoic acid receptor responder protein 2 n=1 Tax=Salarias fasciatus TaxID=181472 RepID=A0A672IUU7_SALFA